MTIEKITDWTGDVEEWGMEDDDHYAWRRRTVVRTQPVRPGINEKEYVYIADENSQYDPGTGEWSSWETEYNEGWIRTEIPEGMALVFIADLEK
jgi:hypothetical protein